MKLSNQNICNLRGCQMPLGGVQIISGGGGHPAPPQKICLNAGGLLKEVG